MSRDQLSVSDVRSAMVMHTSGPRGQEQRLAALELRVAHLEGALEQAYTALATWQRTRIGRKVMAMFGEVTRARDDTDDDRGSTVRGSPMGN
jgi:hypothetical protein